MDDKTTIDLNYIFKVDNFLDNHVPVFGTFEPFNFAYLSLQSILTDIEEEIPLTDLDTKSATNKKKSAKQAMAKAFSRYGSRCAQWAERNNQEEKVGDLRLTKTDIFQAKDADAIGSCTRIRAFMNDNLTVLDGYRITATVLAEADAALSKFTDLIPKAGEIGVDSGVASEKLTALIKDAKKEIAVMRELVDEFEDSNPDFFAGFQAADVIENIGVRHTQLNGYVTDAQSGEAREGVVIEIEGTGKSDSSDLDGFYSIIKFLPGLRRVLVLVDGNQVQDHVMRFRRGEVHGLDFEV